MCLYFWCLNSLDERCLACESAMFVINSILFSVSQVFYIISELTNSLQGPLFNKSTFCCNYFLNFIAFLSLIKSLFMFPVGDCCWTHFPDLEIVHFVSGNLLFQSISICRGRISKALKNNIFYHNVQNWHFIDMKVPNPWDFDS